MFVIVLTFLAIGNGGFAASVSGFARARSTDFTGYPCQVLLKYNGHYFCGGSILDSYNILTSAHCLKHDPDQSRGNFTVLAGEHNISQVEGTEQEREVSNVVMHEDYDDVWQFNDIAILHLSRPLDMDNGMISSVQLSNTLFDNAAMAMTDSCFISGWGLFHDDTHDPDDDIPELLSTKIISNSECNDLLSPLSVNEKMACTLNENQGACNVDGGGPMGCYDSEGNFRQIGIISWNNGHCSEGKQVYTLISQYESWVADNKYSQTGEPAVMMKKRNEFGFPVSIILADFLF